MNLNIVLVARMAETWTNEQLERAWESRRETAQERRS